MRNTCLIIAGAPTCYIPETSVRPEFVIACDYGYAHALSAGIRPDLVLGDFDSYHDPLPLGLQIKTVPVEKDDTDSMLAIREALERGYKKIIISGGLGGRIDHEISNFAALAFAAERGANCYLVDEHHQIFAVRNTTCRISRGNWTGISIFSFNDIAAGVTLKGLKYPLTDGTLTNSFPLGVSNSFTADTAEITVKDGTLLIVLTDLA